MSGTGEMSLFSDAFSALNIYGDESRVNLSTKRHAVYYEGGLAKYDWFELHSSGKMNITPFWQSFAKSSEVRIGSDRETVETEQATTGMIAFGTTSPYVDKAIIRSGQIVNMGQSGVNALLKHAYQIETRHF